MRWEKGEESITCIDPDLRVTVAHAVSIPKSQSAHVNPVNSSWIARHEADEPGEPDGLHRSVRTYSNTYWPISVAGSLYSLQSISWYIWLIMVEVMIIMIIIIPYHHDHHDTVSSCSSHILIVSSCPPMSIYFQPSPVSLLNEGKVYSKMILTMMAQQDGIAWWDYLVG